MSVTSLRALVFLLVSLSVIHCQPRFLQEKDAEEDGKKADTKDDEQVKPEPEKKVSVPNAEEEQKPLSDEELSDAHKEFDVNHDSEATRQEMVNFAGAHQREVDEADDATKQYLKEKDKSKDGLISLQEHMEEVAGADDPAESDDVKNLKIYEEEKFKAADTNGDGSLDKDELPTLLSPRTHSKMVEVEIKHHLRSNDQDKNGKIEFEEFENSGIVENYDDHGTIANSLTDDEKTEQDKIKATGGPDAEEQQDEFDNRIAAKRLFKRLDVNSDGSLTADELKPVATGQVEHEDIVDSLIGTLDKDGDKTVDTKELVEGKMIVSDSSIQDYLIAWARHRQVVPSR